MKILVVGKGGRSQDLLADYLEQNFNVYSAVEASSKWKTFCYRLKKRSVHTVLGQYAFTLLVKIQSFFDSESPKGTEDAKTFHLSSLNNPQLTRVIVDINPDYMVLAGSSILNFKYVPESHKKSILNIHLGITPSFRGVYGGFWAIYTSHNHLYGVTLHFVNGGIDTGKVISQSIMQPISLLNIHKQNRQLYEVGYQLLEDFLKNRPYESDKIKVDMNRLWFHPTIIQYFKLLNKVIWKTNIKS